MLSKAMRILVVEDDRKVAAFIQRGLEEEGYAVDVLHDGSEAGVHATCIDYDAAVLDLMLPGRSGLQVLRDLRAKKGELPVLILTAKDSLDERVAGLDAGADDYMVKPLRLRKCRPASARFSGEGSPDRFVCAPLIWSSTRSSALSRAEAVAST